MCFNICTIPDRKTKKTEAGVTATWSKDDVIKRTRLGVEYEEREGREWESWNVENFYKFKIFCTRPNNMSI